MRKYSCQNGFSFAKKYCVFSIALLIITSYVFSQQPTNLNPATSYINVNTPKTPESAAFEKYGNTEVNEFTGTSNIQIPIYTLQSRFLSIPIKLSYQANGIKVNQEASWVGLGWDLIAGGRITVETRGCADFSGSTWGLRSVYTDTAMTQIFARLGSHGENAVLTPATYWEPPRPPQSLIDTNTYNGLGISEMTQFGTGEPDIFRANFLGHSVTFYIDKITNSINFLGEQSFFRINYTLDSYHNITSWTIVDDGGITYYFNQTEVTTNTLPGSAIVPFSLTSAWLLTKIEHPSGDYIQFTYSNYGYTVPAFTMSGSIDVSNAGSGTIVSSDVQQNISLQSTYYLTRIESSDAVADFVLDTRTDLYGPGSRRLSQIKVSDKISNTLKKIVTFHYSYFQTTANSGIRNYLGGLSYNLPSPLTTSAYIATSSSRLRLDSVYLVDNTKQPPYRFYYKSVVPDKYSYGQDHWGFYNAVSNETNGYSFSHLIPYSSIQGCLPPANLGFNSSMVGFSRECDVNYMQAMSLDSLVYPTGGSSKLIYEPHQSSLLTGGSIIGGGLRVKIIRNYAEGNLSGTKEFTYSSGKFMGAFHYCTTANLLASCNNTSPFAVGHYKYSSNGAINFNDILVGYGQIIISEKDANGNSNGSLIKSFDINTSSNVYANGGAGFDIQPPYFFNNQYTVESTTDATGYWTYDKWLDASHQSFAPTPSANLEGKLMQEQFFDNSNNLLKSVSYYYHLANYSNSFYDVKAIQNREGGFNTSCGGTSVNTGIGTGGLRPVNLFVSPAKSYHTLKDSVVEFTYSGMNAVKKKIAYQYNLYYQPMYETLYNSDGTQTINYTRTSAEIYVPMAGPPSGLLASQMYQMLNQHAIDLPIEQTVIKRGIAGDSSVISSRFNVYQNTLPLQAYILETEQPLTFRSQFVPWYYQNNNQSNYSVIIDGHYKLYSNADYSPNKMIWTLHTLQGDKAFIWDESYNTLLAQCSNTDSSNVAFTSFETQAKGRWTYNQSGVVADNTSPTGNNAYNLSIQSISLASLTSSDTYIISYWKKGTGSYTVTGSTSVIQGRTFNGWTYYEHKVTGVTSATISGAGSIDEVRLYPSTSQMISYTYSPLIGITSECDPNNRITYYFYDGIGRLSFIKDQDGNIVKTFQYHYQGMPGLQY